MPAGIPFEILRCEYKSAKPVRKVQQAAALCHRPPKLEKNNTKPLSWYKKGKDAQICVEIYGCERCTESVAQFAQF